MFKLAYTGTWDLLVVHITTSVNLKMRRSRNSDILVHGRLAQDVSAVVDELLTEHLGELICLTAVRRAVVDVILHEVEKSRV